MRKLAPYRWAACAATMRHMATASDIEHLVDKSTEWIAAFYLEGNKAVDVPLLRSHVSATLVYLAAASHGAGCYWLLEDLVDDLTRA